MRSPREQNGTQGKLKSDRSRVRRYPHKIKESPMKGFVEDMEDSTEANSDFRHALYTGKNMQLVLMARLCERIYGTAH
jgi:hypothetical protein